MTLLKHIAGAAALVTTLVVAPNASAVVTTFDDEAAYLAASLPTERVLYNFDAPGFPDASVDEMLIGVVNGIDFGGARVRNDPGSAVSGTQVLVGDGPGCCFGTTTIDFTGSAFGPITGFGFFGLDLVADEIIRLTVGFSGGPDQVFDFGLDGAANLTPTFFGLTSSMDDIVSLTIAGFRADGTTVAPWGVDNLSVVFADVPLPGALPLLLSGIAGLGFAARRQKKV